MMMTDSTYSTFSLLASCVIISYRLQILVYFYTPQFLTPKVVAVSKIKDALYLSVNVFSTKVLIGDTIFTSPTGDGTAILRGHPSHAKAGLPVCRAKEVPSFLS